MRRQDVDTEKLEHDLRAFLQSEARAGQPSINWWNQAVTRAMEQKRRSSWLALALKTRLAWAIVPLAILLFAGTAYGASSVVRELFERYADHLDRIGGTQQLDLSQTKDGITMRLERAYADANAVLVGLTVSGPDEAYYTDGGRLSLVGGQDLPGVLGLGSLPGSDVFRAWNPSERLALIAAYDASVIQGMPADLHLRLRIQAGKDPSFLNIPFSFDFSVPFNAGKTIYIGETVENAGEIITLEQVVITPWATRAVFQLSSRTDTSGGRGIPVVTLDIPNGVPVSGSLGHRSPTPSAEHFEYFIGDFGRFDGDWTIVVTEIVFPPTGNNQGIETQQPSDTKRVTGPWVFRFRVP